MKQILVPTDFSDFAYNAFDAAIQLAQKFGAELHCLHKGDLPKDFADSDLLTEEEKQEARRKTKLLKALLDTSESRDVRCQVALYGGKLSAAINTYISDKDIDFLVIGSHGASGKKEYFIGSNAQKIVRSIHRPVLIIKKPIEKLNFDRVIYASDFNEKDRISYAKFLNIIRPFYAEIHLLAINTSSFFTQPSLILYDAMKDFQKMSAPLKVKSHFYNDISVDAGIRHFSESIKADLIVISNHERHPVKRMFQGSNVELVVNHAELPVLSIDYD